MSPLDPLNILCRALTSAGLPVQRDEPMSGHTTWRIGGPADAYILPDTFEQLRRAIQETRKAGLPHVVIGRGSNLLFADEGFRGVVLKVGRPLSQIEVVGNQMVSEAGALTCRAALAACRNRLAGLEHIVGIPGTMGGLIAMNGGSQRQSIGDAVEWVEGCDEEGRPFRLDREACQFSYRDSRFLRERGRVVFRCALSLPQGDRTTIRRAMLDDLKERRKKFPLHLPNCGSVFKSSPSLFTLAGPPGKIIEDCGFKGRRAGDAVVSSLHANFITNMGQAKAADVLELIRQIRLAVHQRWGVWMEAEVKYVLPQGGVVPAHCALPALGFGPGGCRLGPRVRTDPPDARLKPTGRRTLNMRDSFRAWLLACPMRLRRRACGFHLTLIAVLSLLPSGLFPPSPLQIPGLDKLVHAALYGVLGALLRWAAEPKAGGMAPASRWLPLAAAGYGLLMEFLQVEMTGGTRHFSWADVAANLIGVCLVWHAAGWWMKGRET